MDADTQLTRHGAAYASTRPEFARFYDSLLSQLFPSGMTSRNKEVYLTGKHAVLSLLGRIQAAAAAAGLEALSLDPKTPVPPAAAASVSPADLVVRSADLGCGTGRTLVRGIVDMDEWLSRRPDLVALGVRFEVVGVDHSKAMLDRAAVRLDKMLPTLELKHPDRFELRLVHASFGGLTAPDAVITAAWSAGTRINDTSGTALPWATGPALDSAVLSIGTVHMLVTEEDNIRMLKEAEKVLVRPHGTLIVPVFQREMVFSDTSTGIVVLARAESGLDACFFERSLLDRKVEKINDEASVVTDTFLLSQRAPTKDLETDGSDADTEAGDYISSVEEKWSLRSTTAAELVRWVEQHTPGLTTTIINNFDDAEADIPTENVYSSIVLIQANGDA
ncbi:hypothetical protein HK105_204379 [Polyrhizophydium stewartii]|uniref:Methyltransferase domain-containing protein n=1 Tax=Polyrhizophydium stewartii TaxID=2732419 RepID=A0ABR4N8U9_9FUNG